MSQAKTCFALHSPNYQLGRSENVHMHISNTVECQKSIITAPPISVTYSVKEVLSTDFMPVHFSKLNLTFGALMER